MHQLDNLRFLLPRHWVLLTCPNRHLRYKSQNHRSRQWWSRPYHHGIITSGWWRQPYLLGLLHIWCRDSCTLECSAFDFRFFRSGNTQLPHLICGLICDQWSDGHRSAFMYRLPRTRLSLRQNQWYVRSNCVVTLSAASVGPIHPKQYRWGGLLLVHMFSTSYFRCNYGSQLVSSTGIYGQTSRPKVYGNCICSYGCFSSDLKRNESLSPLRVCVRWPDRYFDLLCDDGVDACCCVIDVLCWEK